MKEKLLKEFSCLICWKVMTLPLTTPCAHNFCKQCLVEAYDDQSFTRERTRGGRTLRTQKIVKKCPSCPNDISDFLQNPQVNRELMDLIESLQKKIEEENVEDSSEQESDVVEAVGEDENDVEKAEDGSNDADKIEGDAAQEELSNVSNDKTRNVGGKLSEEESDGHGIEAKLESVNGDSEVHAANSEMEEECGEGDCQSPASKTDMQASSHKRKQAVNRKGAGKKTRKSEDSYSVKDIEENQEDARGRSMANSVSPKGRGRKRKAQSQENGSSPHPPSNQNRRVTRQMKLRGES